MEAGDELDESQNAHTPPSSTLIEIDSRHDKDEDS
jgi:hypothetical protein